MREKNLLDTVERLSLSIDLLQNPTSSTMQCTAAFEQFVQEATMHYADFASKLCSRLGVYEQLLASYRAGSGGSSPVSSPASGSRVPLGQRRRDLFAEKYSGADDVLSAPLTRITHYAKQFQLACEQEMDSDDKEALRKVSRQAKLMVVACNRAAENGMAGEAKALIAIGGKERELVESDSLSEGKRRLAKWAGIEQVQAIVRGHLLRVRFRWARCHGFCCACA